MRVVPNPRADAHGFLKSFGHKWAWEGTENVFVPQLVMWDTIVGDNSPRTFHNKPALVDRKIEQFIVGHGFNGFHLPVVGGRWFDLDAESDRVESRMTEPDSRTFEALELLITRRTLVRLRAFANSALTTAFSLNLATRQVLG